MTHRILTPSHRVSDLSNCDKEAIQAIGHIQDLGYLIVLDRKNNRIVQASQNIDDLTEVPAQEIVGRSVDEFFPKSLLGYLDKFIDPSDPLDQHSLKIELYGKSYVLSTHFSEGYLVLEIEKDDEKERESSYLHYSDFVENIILDTDLYDSIEEVCHNIILKAREITGFNRMMVYKFDEEGHGEVIAESGEKGMQSYKGLKFPASDIPGQARMLYLRNTIRGIWDVEGASIPVYPELRQEDGKPLDMSRSFMRSISPTHIQYLKNMQVRSSFSISLVVKDQLWGLILCHHTEQPVRLNVYQRRACQFIGRVLSYRIESKSEDLGFREYHNKLQLSHRIVSAYFTSANLHLAVEENHQELLRVFKGSGYAVIFDNKLSYSEHIDNIWLNQLITEIQLQDETVFHTCDLTATFPKMTFIPSAPAGVLAIKLSQNLNEFLLIFRKEEEKQVNWAGRPTHNTDPSQPLLPRKSFEKWTEMIKGQSRGWSTEEVQFAKEFRLQLIENIITATSDLNHTHHSGKNKLRMRLIERVYELEETNKHMEAELKSLRRRETQQRLAREIAEEKNRLQAITIFKT